MGGAEGGGSNSSRIFGGGALDGGGPILPRIVLVACLDSGRIDPVRRSRSGELGSLRLDKGIRFGSLEGDFIPLAADTEAED